MFTGIVQDIGTVVERRASDGVLRLRIQAPKTVEGLSLGASVAVNGVCLTAVRVQAGTFTVEAIPETARATNIGRLAAGSRVNLERSLRLSDRLDGHLVLGHVDGAGKIVRVRPAAGQLQLEIRLERSLARFLVPKGPVTVDGVSLTVGPAVSRGTFSVFLIPETLRQTVLSQRKAGDLVNLELDYVAKLVLQRRRS